MNAKKAPTTPDKSSPKISDRRRPCSGAGCRMPAVPEPVKITDPIQRAVRRASAGQQGEGLGLGPADVLTLQRTAGNRTVQRLLAADPGRATVQRRRALPKDLQAGVENLSGIAMDGVRVHYGSSLPATVQAASYAQGADIHVAPGQEHHLPHEAWHVVQQAQGRVQPTMSLNGVKINDNPALEREADVMGTRASRFRPYKEDEEAA